MTPNENSSLAGRADSETEKKPAVSVLVCTRNRGDSLTPTVRTILANAGVDELVVMDQSTNDDTAAAIAPFQSDPRLRYLRTETQGKGRALNLGLNACRADVVLITDDDCEVPPEWAQKFASVFAENPGVAMAFCNTKAAPGEWPGGYIPTFERTGDLLLTKIRDRCKINPLGAGMAVRRKVVLEIGGFDEYMGPGAAIASHDEDDLALRCLLRGHQLFETDRTFVYHYGFRTIDESKALTYRNYHGTGGGMAKLLKCRQWPILTIAGYIVWATIILPLLGSAARLQKPRVVSRITGFYRGFAQGLKMPADSEKLIFKG